MTYKTKYDLPPRAASPAGGVSLTDRSELANCDINVIVRRYNAGDDSVVRTSGIYADVSEIGDLAQSMDTVMRAKRDFAALPADVRARFGNDPVALVSWLQDAGNVEEAVRLGLRVRTTQERIVDSVDSVTAPKAAESAKPDDGRGKNT